MPRSFSSTLVPITDEGTSRPLVSSSCTISSTVSSRVRRLVERFSKAFAILAANLRRSNGSWVLSRFTPRRSERSISSYVVNRYLHFKHSRRRRILELSRDCRESMTLPSREQHVAHRIVRTTQSQHHE